MKKIIFAALVICFVSCKTKEPEPDWQTIRYTYADGLILAMPERYKRLTGFDSICINSDLHHTELTADFCDPNEWRFNKRQRDTIYLPEKIMENRLHHNRNIGGDVSIKSVNQSGGITAEQVINNQ